ncbi:hypothetical protein GRI75_09540 [Altererythrobacter soli]|uniref:Resolvase/invertase-type recombinase catalytic domain-containing protein n=1 Tax=Croceibacterium soli TaxID=1739690 RepID=A0A6I4UWG7_9SPHN|nr:recombinase family protein [Croceibacterium soli]MXP41883.1 hypothetical protein [Croceibacterium soli]
MHELRYYQTACGYVRSSTSDAIPDTPLIQQSFRIGDYCLNSHHILTRTVIEAERCGKQRKLKRLLHHATSDKRPFDIFVVDAASRLTRDLVKFERIRGRLAEARVTLVVLDPMNIADTAPTWVLLR